MRSTEIQSVEAYTLFLKLIQKRSRLFLTGIKTEKNSNVHSADLVAEKELMRYTYVVSFFEREAINWKKKKINCREKRLRLI